MESHTHEKDDQKFRPKLHKKYLLRMINSKLPSFMSSQDSARLLIAYFSISGLDVLNELKSIEKQKQTLINWIYYLMVEDDEELVSGFQGSTTFVTEDNRGRNSLFKWGHIAYTYSALSTLVILGDDLKRVNRPLLLKSLKSLQLADGSFKGAKDGTENDMRFVFCASCICYILNDWSGMDLDKTVDFILKSISYEGGFGQGPYLEAHSGSTFCAIASLFLSNQLHRLSNSQVHALRRWLVNRCGFGFNGRPNKPADTCYSLWTGGALKILNSYQYIRTDEIGKFVVATQDRYGGFSKWINTMADPMHTYFGLCGLSLMGVEGLNPIFCGLIMTERAHEHLKTLHSQWS